MKKKKKIYRDKKGREFIKEPYFVDGKMKIRRVYVIDGIPVDEFYRQNATDMDFFMNDDYELMETDNTKNINELDTQHTNNSHDLPF